MRLNDTINPEQVLINQAVIQAQLEFLNNYESELRRASQDNHWSTVVGHYIDAALETVIEIRADIANNPWQYGAMAAECIPGGIGAIATIGNKGYEVSTTDKTVLAGTGELVVEAAIGAVGGKLIKGVGKGSKFIYKTIAAKVHKAKLDKACNLTTGKARKAFGQNIGIEFEPQFWNKSVQVGKNKVYQRNDLIDPKRFDPEGNTSLNLMKNGKAPIGPDGKKINLHHMLQTKDAGIAEVTSTFHQQHTKIIHINPKTMGSGINRNDFKKWRESYWKLRAKDFE